MKKGNKTLSWVGAILLIIALCLIIMGKKAPEDLKALMLPTIIGCIFLGGICWGMWLNNHSPYSQFSDIKEGTIINILHLNHDTPKDKEVVLMVEGESDIFLIKTERSSFNAKDPLPGNYVKKEGKLSRIEFTDQT